MPAPRPASIGALLLFTLTNPASPQNGPDSVPPARPVWAIGEALLVNVFVNRVDAWVLGQDFAKVKPKDWSRNFRLGWEWDENTFGTNMFAHPYHGGLYFNAGRHNGLSYWESIPLAFLGSWNWEFMGEKHRPALNDFFMTSFGGVALGEVFHRISRSIRNDSLSGFAHTWREAAALPFDPIGAVNDMFGAERKDAVRPASSYVLRVSAGARIAADSGFVDPDEEMVFTTSPTAVIDLNYGDPLGTAYQEPFDVFNVRLQLSGAAKLNVLRASGRMFSRPVNRVTSRHRHVFAVNQRYDFIDNPAHKFGEQSVELGVYSRWRVGKQSAIRTEFFGDAVMLGALDAPRTGLGERTYDFGPGAGLRLDLGYERRGITYVSLWARYEFIHSISGARADHHVSFGGTEVTIPIKSGVGIGLQSGYYRRRSEYADETEQLREFPEVRISATWTTSRLPVFGQ